MRKLFYVVFMLLFIFAIGALSSCHKDEDLEIKDEPAIIPADDSTFVW